MTGIPDEFTRMETACAILRDYGSDLLGDGGREIYEADYATRIFEAIGLPALLERVEAAEREADKWHTTATSARVEIVETRRDLDALAAKVALTELERAALTHAIEVYTGPDDDTVPVLRSMLTRAGDERDALAEGAE